MDGLIPYTKLSKLEQEVNNLTNIGRFLSLWNCSTGLPVSNPSTIPYNYKTGDYYIVHQVADGGCTHHLDISGDASELGIYSGTYKVSFSFKNQISTEYSTISSIADAVGETRISAEGILYTDEGEKEITGVLKWDIEGQSVIALLDSEDQKIGLTLTTADSIVDYVTGGIGSTNYKPDGATYTGAASTIVDSSTIIKGSVYYFDGTLWLLH